MEPCLVKPMLSKHNPLVLPILGILKASPVALSEHQLTALLQQPLQALDMLADGSQLALFQRHFLVNNALYQLQQSLFDDGYYLAISALSIELQALTGPADKLLVDGQQDNALRQYYLDWANFDNTSQQDVDTLLNGFWQYFTAADKQLEASQILGISVDSEWPVIQKAYRRLVADNHPDRGGKAADFVRLREAYQRLATIHGK